MNLVADGLRGLSIQHIDMRCTAHIVDVLASLAVTHLVDSELRVLGTEAFDRAQAATNPTAAPLPRPTTPLLRRFRPHVTMHMTMHIAVVARRLSRLGRHVDPHVNDGFPHTNKRVQHAHQSGRCSFRHVCLLKPLSLQPPLPVFSLFHCFLRRNAVVY
jgi:hypothetical protein